MFDKMKQLMDMKAQAEKLKRELEATTVESEEVRGIKIFVDGTQNIRDIKIEDQYFNSNSKQNFERDLVRSVNAANKKIQGLAAQKFASSMPGM